MNTFLFSRYYREKIGGLVDFPIEGLDLTSRVKGPIEEGVKYVYDLYAVSDHHGGYGGGHCLSSFIYSSLLFLLLLSLLLL